MAPERNSRVRTSKLQQAIDDYTAEREILDRLIQKLREVQGTKPKAPRKPRAAKESEA